jgi:hypothetical protein
MLDNLDQSSGPLKTLTETWLVHSLTRGDLFRILEPHLLTLLDPRLNIRNGVCSKEKSLLKLLFVFSTARVSVIHCLVEICTSPSEIIDIDSLERRSAFSIKFSKSRLIGALGYFLSYSRNLPKVYIVKTVGGEIFHHIAVGAHSQWKYEKVSNTFHQ